MASAILGLSEEVQPVPPQIITCVRIILNILRFYSAAPMVYSVMGFPPRMCSLTIRGTMAGLTFT